MRSRGIAHVSSGQERVELSSRALMSFMASTSRFLSYLFLKNSMRAPDSYIVATMRSLFPLTFRQSSGSMIPVLSIKKKKCSFLRDARLSICIKIRLLRKKACIISAIHWNPEYARFRSRPWGPTGPSYARRRRACSSCARSCCRSSRRREYGGSAASARLADGRQSATTR